MFRHLMFDEIKLKNSIAYNCKNNEITGFVQDHFNTKSLHEFMKNNDRIDSTVGKNNKKKKEKGSTNKVSIYANQWRYRSASDKVHNGDFYYNTGSLGSNEILRQFHKTLFSYESVGIKEYRLVCHSGGGYRKFYDLLKKENEVDAFWLDKGMTSFVNPYNNNRSMFMWFCSTHSVKSIRNNLYKLQHQLAQSFLIDDISFGWKQIRDCYDRKKFRMDNTLSERTWITEHVVMLDKYATMNAAYAKIPFEDKKICKMLQYVADTLNVKLDCYNIKSKKFK